tara:strand:+ start:702 stop:992 length:291 start_codon:yes stop_codon:yes gene_type:complete
MEADLKEIFRHETKFIEPCALCKGEGVIHYEVETHPSDSDDNYIKICKQCDGDGRRVCTHTHIRYQVFGSVNNHEFKVYEPITGRALKDIYKIGKQ